VTGASGAYSNEIAWVAGGGGPSLFEAARGYQQGVAPPVGRGVPDVAMDADPNSGANVYVNGQPEGVGGTSLSSPLALGVWARMQSARGNRLGFAGKRLYAARGTTAFHDITSATPVRTRPRPATTTRRDRHLRHREGCRPNRLTWDAHNASLYGDALG